MSSQAARAITAFIDVSWVAEISAPPPPIEYPPTVKSSIFNIPNNGELNLSFSTLIVVIASNKASDLKNGGKKNEFTLTRNVA